MLTLWNPYRDREFGSLRRAWSAVDELRHEMDRMFTNLGTPRSEAEATTSTNWPRIQVRDEGEALLVWASVPGLSEKDVQVTVTGNSVTLSGERRADPPEGYSVHLKERCHVHFSRSFFLPTKVDAEKAEARVKNGILELTLPKAAEAKPKQIPVKAS